jgi:hypothetical protein
MEMGSLDRYAPLETALNGAGFRVDEVEKQGRRTDVTVFRCGQAGEKPDFPVLKAGVPVVAPEEQGANGL